MAGIKINTGVIRLEVECDGRKDEISFNPDDVDFLENLYGLMGELEKKKMEFAEAEKKLNEDQTVDTYGIPTNMKQRLALLKEVCTYIRGQIDQIFGEGTSQKVFGNANTIEMFDQFFDGITPYIYKNRQEKLAKYTAAGQQNVMQ